MDPRKARRVTGAIVILLVVYLFGYVVGHENLSIERSGKLSIQLGTRNAKTLNTGYLQNVYSLLQQNFLGTLEPQKITEEAARGLVAASGDPYTVYLTAEESQKFNEELKGEFGGVGIEVGIRDKQPTVIATLEGSPAQKAGIKSKDIIVSIDDKTTAQLSLDEIVEAIRGPAGTMVSIAINRPGGADKQEFRITRETIKVTSVKSEIKNGNVGYIQINQFGDDTLDLVRVALGEFKAKAVTRLIFDVRNNPGGLLESVIDVSSLVLQKDSVVVKEENKDNKVDEDRTTLEPLMTDAKLVVLIDSGSASAAEILAGAVQDNKRGTVVGEKSFGKGLGAIFRKIAGRRHGAHHRRPLAHPERPRDRSSRNCAGRRGCARGNRGRAAGKSARNSD